MKNKAKKEETRGQDKTSGENWFDNPIERNIFFNFATSITCFVAIVGGVCYVFITLPNKAEEASKTRAQIVSRLNEVDESLFNSKYSDIKIVKFDGVSVRENEEGALYDVFGVSESNDLWRYSYNIPEQMYIENKNYFDSFKNVKKSLSFFYNKDWEFANGIIEQTSPSEVAVADAETSEFVTLENENINYSPLCLIEEQSGEIGAMIYNPKKSTDINDFLLLDLKETKNSNASMKVNYHLKGKNFDESQMQ